MRRGKTIQGGEQVSLGLAEMLKMSEIYNFFIEFREEFANNALAMQGKDVSGILGFKFKEEVKPTPAEILATVPYTTYTIF